MTRKCEECGKRRRIWYAGCCETCYIARQREMNRLRNTALSRLDGSPESAVALLADISPDQIDEYGGMPTVDTPRKPSEE